MTVSLDAILEACARASIGDLAARVPVPEDAPDDDAFTVLAHAFNILLGDLDYRTAEKEAALRALASSRETLYRAIFEQALEGIAAVSQDGVFVEVNAEYARMLGYDRSELVGKPIDCVIHDADRESNAELVRRLMSGEAHAFREEYDLRRKDGSSIRVEYNAVLVDLPGGSLLKFLVNDVTARRDEEHVRQALLEVTQAANQAETEEELATRVTRTLSRFVGPDNLVGLYTITPDGRHLRFVDGVNYPPELVATVGLQDSAGPGPAVEAVRTRRVVHIEDVLKDARMAWAEPGTRSADIRSLACVPIVEADMAYGTLHLATVGGAIIDARDIRLFERAAREIAHTLARRRTLDALAQSERRLRSLASEQAKMVDRLRRLNEELEDFTYTVAHDVSEPLRGIETLSSYVLDSAGARMAPEDRDMLARVQGSATRLKGMVKGMLELSRIGRRPLTKEDFDPTEVAHAVLKGLEDHARSAGVAIRLAPLPPRIRAQRVGFEQVLVNLVSNAIRYAERHGVQVEIGGEESDGAWSFHVKDDGPGIPAEYHERIFQVFQRGPQAARVEGTGAGLAIVRKIVQQHDGRVWVESEAGRGCTFRFTIARESATGDEPRPTFITPEPR